MAKWADYCIFAVLFNNVRTHIVRVKAFPDQGDSFGAAIELSRGEVVNSLKRDVTFVTVFIGANGKYQLGKPVFVIVINNNEYIKTVRDATAVDNLDNLPEF